MKHKKLLTKGLSLALAMTALITPIYAETGAVEPTRPPVLSEPGVSEPIPIALPKDEVEDQLNYIGFEGVVEDVILNSNGVSLKLRQADNEAAGEAVFILQDGTQIFSADGKVLKGTDIKKGMTVTGYYRKDMPMLMIYPPQISPDVVVVTDPDTTGGFNYSFFDEALLSADGSLKLRIDEDTIITDTKGEALDEEALENKDLIVFYDVVLESYPAQATPTRIIVLDEPEKLLPVEVYDIVFAEGYFSEDIQMVPLRKIAETLGYTVTWNGESRSVTLELDGKLELKIGDTAAEAAVLEAAPVLIDGVTFVPLSYIEFLNQ